MQEENWTQETVRRDVESIMAQFIEGVVDQRTQGRPLMELWWIAEMQDYLEAHKFDIAKSARQMGHTWTEVGAALGISKQAAAKRYRG